MTSRHRQTISNDGIKEMINELKEQMIQEMKNMIDDVKRSDLPYYRPSSSFLKLFLLSFKNLLSFPLLSLTFLFSFSFLINGGLYI